MSHRLSADEILEMATSLAAYCRAYRWRVRMRRSKSSTSIYLTLISKTKTLKVRFADHFARGWRHVSVLHHKDFLSLIERVDQINRRNSTK